MISVRTAVSAQQVTLVVALTMLAEYFHPDADWQWEKILGGRRAIHVSGPGRTPTTFTASTADMRVLRQAMVVHETEALASRWTDDGYKAEIWRLLCYRMQVGAREGSGPAGILLRFIDNQPSDMVRAALFCALLGENNPTDETIRAAYGEALAFVPAAV